MAANAINANPMAKIPIFLFLVKMNSKIPPMMANWISADMYQLTNKHCKRKIKISRYQLLWNIHFLIQFYFWNDELINYRSAKNWNIIHFSNFFIHLSNTSKSHKFLFSPFAPFEMRSNTRKKLIFPKIIPLWGPIAFFVGAWRC